MYYIKEEEVENTCSIFVHLAPGSIYLRFMMFRPVTNVYRMTENNTSFWCAYDTFDIRAFLYHILLPKLAIFHSIKGTAVYPEAVQKPSLLPSEESRSDSLLSLRSTLWLSLSSEPETIIFPYGENETGVTGSVWWSWNGFIRLGLSCKVSCLRYGEYLLQSHVSEISVQYD